MAYSVVLRTMAASEQLPGNDCMCGLLTMAQARSRISNNTKPRSICTWSMLELSTT